MDQGFYLALDGFLFGLFDVGSIRFLEYFGTENFFCLYIPYFVGGWLEFFFKLIENLVFLVEVFVQAEEI